MFFENEYDHMIKLLVEVENYTTKRKWEEKLKWNKERNPYKKEDRTTQKDLLYARIKRKGKERRKKV